MTTPAMIPPDSGLMPRIFSLDCSAAVSTWPGVPSAASRSGAFGRLAGRGDRRARESRRRFDGRRSGGGSALLGFSFGGAFGWSGRGRRRGGGRRDRRLAGGGGGRRQRGRRRGGAVGLGRVGFPACADHEQHSAHDESGGQAEARRCADHASSPAAVTGPNGVKGCLRAFAWRLSSRDDEVQPKRSRSRCRPDLRGGDARADTRRPQRPRARVRRHPPPPCRPTQPG